MPVMTLFRSPRIDQAQYDALIQAMDLENQPQPGVITHTCAFDKNGIHVVDVWESRLALEGFIANRLKPAFAKLSMPFVEPEVILETYEFQASEEVDRYKVGQGPSFGADREMPEAGGPTLHAG
jgi:hypothetical protein